MHGTQELAKRGATLHMVCRNPERGQEAVQRIIESTGNKDVHLQVESKHLARGIHKWLYEIRSRLSLLYCP